MWKTILVPHDFSECADKACALARDLARVHGARLVLLHVAELPSMLGPMASVVPDEGGAPISVRDYALRGATSFLEELAARMNARADADILVLDEPTASMDAEAEVQIFERFRELTSDKIAIVISHRFSTVRMADQIIVLSAGKIIERGTHAELVAAGGKYARLFEMQARGYQ